MTLRIAMLSFWHVHGPDYARQAREHPDTDVVAVWDEEAGRGRKWADELGAEFHERLPQLLARTDIDAVVVTAPTSAHTDVITQAARAGKHVFTEKVLAPSVRECEEILGCVETSGSVLMLSLPRLYDGYTTAIRDVLADDLLGDVTLVRVRLVHGGAVGKGWLPEHFYDPRTCGGGALIDLGCHPMYLARLFLGGLPESIVASFGHVTGRAVEDNAVATLRCSNGALGVVEAGFAAGHSPFSIEIHGTHGSLLYGVPEPKLLLRSARGSADGWSELPLAPSSPSAFEQFVRHIAEGTKPTENIAMGLDLTRLMEAAYQSARTGHEVSVTGGSSS